MSALKWFDYATIWYSFQWFGQMVGGVLKGQNLGYLLSGLKWLCYNMIFIWFGWILGGVLKGQNLDCIISE